MVEPYQFKVELIVGVDAFEESDAREIIEEYFGGEGIGAVTIYQSSISRVDITD